MEDAERAVAQETSFQEELSRLKLKRSIAPQLQMIRDAQREGLKISAEQWQRRKMHEEVEEQSLDNHGVKRDMPASGKC